MKKSMLILAVVMLSGCSLLNLPTVISPKPPDTRYQYHEIRQNNPEAVIIGDRVVVAHSQRHEISSNYINEEKPLNWWQRLCNKLANLTIVTVLIGGGLLAAGVTGPFLWIYNRYLVFRKTTTQVIRAVEKTKATETQPELKNTLSSMLDTDSKKLIDDIKRS